MKRLYLSSFPMRAVFCATLLLAPGGALLSAQQPPQLPPPGQALSPNQLDDLVAPIALYPDPLVSWWRLPTRSNSYKPRSGFNETRASRALL